MFKKMFSTQKSKVIGVSIGAGIVIALIFLLICSLIPDSGRLNYKLLSDDTYEVTDIKNLYRGGILSKTELTIPEYYGGKKVSSIKKINSLVIEKLIIPDTVTKIGGSAFMGMIKLKEIKLPSFLEEISVNTFGNCYELNNVVVPDTVTKIGERAFFNCLELDNLVLKGSSDFEAQISFYQVGAYAFERSKIEEKYMNKDTGMMIVANKLFKIDFKNEKVTKNIVIPEGVTEIIGGAFNEYNAENKQIETVELPSTLKIINDYSFTKCTKINKVFLNSILDEVSQYAFNNCGLLKNKVYKLEGPIEEKKYDNADFASMNSVFLKDGIYCTNVYLTKEDRTAKIQTLMEFDLDANKPYMIIAGEKQFFNQGTYKFKTE